MYTDTDSIAYFIKDYLNGTIPAEYKDLQGRINLVNGSTTSSSTEQPRSDNNTDSWRFYQRKKSQGLSTGGIIAIIIPSIVALIAVAVIAMMCVNKNTPTQNLSNLNTNISNNSHVGLKIRKNKKP